MLKSYLLTFLISMVPLVELRGAIPFGMAAVNPPLPLLHAYVVSILGNMVPVPLIYLFARKILLWGKNKPLIGRPFCYLLSRGEESGRKKMDNPFTLPFFSLWGFPCREREPGRELWPLPCWIWILKSLPWPLWAGFFWRD